MATIPKHLGVKQQVYRYNEQLCIYLCRISFKLKLSLLWNENCALLVPYALYIGICLPKFREKYRLHIQGKKSCTLKFGPIGCPERSVSNYHCLLCNIPAERIFYVIHNGKQMIRPFNTTVTFPYTGTNRLLASSLSLCSSFLMSRQQILTIMYTCTYKHGRFMQYLIFHRLSLFYMKLHSSIHVCLLRTHQMASDLKTYFLL